MAIRKYASLEQAQVLGLKGTQEKERTASLDKFADYSDFRTSDGYLYARIRAISSRVNKNHDGWPSVELAGSEDVFNKHLAREGGFTVEASDGHDYGFATFVGKPIFVDHNNSNPERARGVIVDAKLHVDDFRTAAELDPYYASAPENHTPPTWVELLLEVDAKTFPKLAKAIIEGGKDSKKGIDGFSMGCDVEKSVCAICKNAATTPDEYCKHVKLKGAEFDWVNPKTGRKESKKSYEDCHGIKFFEISAVFDPADETALTREIIHEARTAGPVEDAHPNLNQLPCKDCGGRIVANDDPKAYYHPGSFPPYMCENCHRLYMPSEVKVPDTIPEHWGAKHHMDGVTDKEDRQYEHIKKQYMEDGKSEEEAAELAARTVNKGKSSAVTMVACPTCGAQAQFSTANRTGVCPNGHTFNNPAQGATPAQRFQPGQAQMPAVAKTAMIHTAEHPVPQSDMMTAPEHVDTLRESEICPVCGSDMDEGHQCDVCGYVAPPDGLDNPDLDQAQETNDLQDPQDLGQAGQNPDVQIPGGQATNPASPPPQAGPPSNLGPTAAVTNDMAWQIYHSKLAGQINPVERPLQTNPRPATNEPQENVLSDQDKPVTNRTAASMIAAVNQGDTMSDTKTAADAPTADTRADKRVDVNGVGGVMDPSAEAASKADAQVDVEGTGGVQDASNAEASAPDRKESLPTADKDGDDSGFNKDKTTDDSGKTKTFDNSNEPGSAVTQKAFPTAAQKTAWGDEGGFPKQDDDSAGETGGAKGGAQPADPVGKADDRVDLLKRVPVGNPQKGTDQWTGTDGNGVTKQQDPVTNEVYAPFTASVVQILKIADAEVELGIIPVEEKYDRIAELEQASGDEINATAKVLARVKTAGLKKSAATKQGGVGKVPSFRSASVVSSDNGADEGLFW